MKIKKLTKINNLKKKIELLKKNNKKIVLCHGVFDLTHVGHHRYFKAAKSYGDYLVVSLTVDKFVNKGYDRPFFNQFYRAESLSSLDFVDFIIFSHEASAVSVINQLKPDYYAKGKEYQNEENDISKKIILEKKAVKKNNGKTVFIDEQVFSSSKILNNSDLIFNKEQKKFLSELKKKYTYIDVLNYLKSLENTKTLIIGEIIIDKYIYVEALGKSGKEPYLAFNEISQETYLGGAAAIARQTYQFANNVRLISMIGEKKEFLNFLNTELGNKINKSLVLKSNSPTIIKKRFIDNISGHKIFGTYIFNDSPLIKSQEIKFKKLINSGNICPNAFSYSG
jgi:rfaE bifunctional protein nucleotidyltransferase chain/domain